GPHFCPSRQSASTSGSGRSIIYTDICDGEISNSIFGFEIRSHIYETNLIYFKRSSFEPVVRSGSFEIHSYVIVCNDYVLENTLRSGSYFHSLRLRSFQVSDKRHVFDGWV